MKKYYYTFIILIANFLSGQTNQFAYEYHFVPDSTQRNVVESEVMILNITAEGSEYFSREKYLSDSAMLEGSKKGLMMMPANKKMIGDRVIKSKNSDKLTYITNLGFDHFVVEQPVVFKWKLHPEYSTMLHHKVQKATTEFGGRRWTAWFTADYPYIEGPYKFSGLPGLIVKVEDETGSHRFELKGIQKYEKTIVYPEVNNYKNVTFSYPQYVKAFKNYREHPYAEEASRIPHQRDAAGNFRKGTDIARELVQTEKERLKKDNNIIEIDLLR